MLKKLKLDLPINENCKILRHPIKSGSFIIPNRLAVHPMEGFDALLDGSPSLLTFRRYKRYANGGMGIIWVEATSISENYKSNKHQLVLTEKNANKFRSFIKKVREILNNTLQHLGFKHKGLIILQLNHSGRYCKKGKKLFPIRAYHNEKLDAAINVENTRGKIISDKELEELEEKWVNRAKLAYKSGFDGVDIKACHGYLISELFGARKRKKSIYGGEDFKNRTRFFLNIIKKVKKRISPSNFILTTRLGIYDGIPYPNGFGNVESKNDGFPATPDFSEPIQLIKLLYSKGVRLLNISSGNPHYKPFLTRPYDVSSEGSKSAPEHPLCSVNRILNLTSKVKNNIPKDMILIGSGYSYLRQFAPYVCSGLINNDRIDICGFGRMSFANPNFARQIFQDNEIDKTKVCITCSQCSKLMKEGRPTGCIVRDSQY
jgi:2,4-dienoyl-CoA reductase-like NADH-dependent reductase (Old Yellow Enzyme family)